MQNVNDVTCKCLIPFLIIKITISSIVIGLKNSYFPLIHSPSCYRTACYRTVCYRTVQQTNDIQSCSLNQPIKTLVSITIETVCKLLNLCILCQFFNVNFLVVTSLGYFSFLGNCNFYDALIGNRTSCRPIRSVIIRVLRGRPILLSLI